MKFLTKGQNPKWKFEYAYAAVFIQDWKAQEAKYRVYRKRFWGWERVNPVLVTEDDFDSIRQGESAVVTDSQGLRYIEGTVR